MKYLFSFAVIFVSVFALHSTAVFAQTNPSDSSRTLDTCTCFCRSDEGAQDLGERADEGLCRDSCKTQGHYYLGCYQSSEQFPENNTLCWTENDCESADSIKTDELGSDWGGQEPQCPTGMGYCYNRVKPIQLGAAINGVQEVDSFSQYIALIYAYLIPAASLLAVVLLMVGGLQYMLSAGREQAVQKAKERMKNAVIGLVILLGAYTIAYLIDPNLVSFNELRIPRVRTVTYLDKDSSCEALEPKGVVVQPLSTSQLCGDEGRIISLAALGENVSVVGVEEGGTCLYQACEDSIAKCVSTPTAEKKYSCIRCFEAVNELEVVTPGDCRRLKHELLDVGQNRVSALDGEIYHYCEFDSQNTNECLEIIYPTSPLGDALNCATLRADARGAGSESCRAYDLVGARGASTFITDGMMKLDDLLTKTVAVGFPTTGLLTKICTEDPCGLAPPGGSCTTWGGLFYYGFVDCVDTGFIDYVDDQVITPNAASRPVYDIPGAYKVTDVNGDLVKFHWTW